MSRNSLRPDQPPCDELLRESPDDGPDLHGSRDLLDAVAELQWVASEFANNRRLLLELRRAQHETR
jgi:hypothetical protein